MFSNIFFPKVVKSRDFVVKGEQPWSKKAFVKIVEKGLFWYLIKICTPK